MLNLYSSDSGISGPISAELLSLVFCRATILRKSNVGISSEAHPALQLKDPLSMTIGFPVDRERYYAYRRE